MDGMFFRSGVVRSSEDVRFRNKVYCTRECVHVNVSDCVENAGCTHEYVVCAFVLYWH